MLRMKALDEAKSARALEAIERSARAQAQRRGALRAV
jgi:hypothetical protein